MKVGQKIKRIFSLKKKDKPKKETADEQASKSGTLPLEPKKRSSSFTSIRRAFSLKREKKPVIDAASSVNTTIESNRNSVQSEPVEITKPVEQVETPKVVDVVVKPTEKPTEDVEAPIEDGFEIIEKLEVDGLEVELEEPIKEPTNTAPTLDEAIERINEDIEQLDQLHGNNNNQGEQEKQAEEQKQEENGTKQEEKEAKQEEEPKVLTEVINNVYDKTEVNQTGNNIIRTVEVEKERKITEDGSTVISSSTKTTTSSVGNGQLKTEFKHEIVAPVSKSRPMKTKENPNNKQVARNMRNMHMACACVVIAVAVVLVWGFRDARMLLTF